jgi:DNA-binding NtrC family response regulator
VSNDRNSLESIYRFQRVLVEADELPEAKRHSLYILGDSSRMQGMLKMIRMAARDYSRILIQGEQGTGKELIADIICSLKGQARPEDLFTQSKKLQLELFGYVEGVDLGAIPWEGALSRAAGESIAIHQIDEMASDIQAALVPVLQRGVFRKVGGDQDLRFEGGMISLTSKNLGDEVKKGRFRGDLYYLLNEITIEVPPLRERSRQDIEMLVQYSLNTACLKAGLTESAHMTCDAMESIFFHYWSGNIYELEGALFMATVESRATGVITKSIIEKAIAERPSNQMAPVLFNSSSYIH